MLGRAIIDHVPPLFGRQTFNQVAASHGGKSIKGILDKLNSTLRNAADKYLHETIRKKEVAPNKVQVNFKVELDFLLSEIIREVSEK